LNVPQQFTQGDTVAWQESVDGYSSADGWALALVLVRIGDAPVTVEATAADGGGFSLELTAATTANMEPTAYSWAARVTKDTARHTVASGQLSVLPDIGAVGADGFDGRSWAEQALEAVEAALLGVASKRHQAHTVQLPEGGTRQVQYLSHGELLTVRDRLRAEIASARQEKNLAENGHNAAGIVRARFR